MNFDESYYKDSNLYKTMNAYKQKRETRVALASSAITVLLGLVLGVVIYNITAGKIGDVDVTIGTYFGGMFAYAPTLGEKMIVLIKCFFHEAAFPALVFVCGYTVFAPLAGATLCLWRAAVCGYAICMLEYTNVGHIFVESVIFLICQIMLISLCVAISIRAIFYSKSFCAGDVGLADVFKRSDSRSYICDFLISAGVMLVTVSSTVVLINFFGI